MITHIKITFIAIYRNLFGLGGVWENKNILYFAIELGYYLAAVCLYNSVVAVLQFALQKI